jgi:Rieske Fe-S protein
MNMAETTRRTVLLGAGAAGLGAVVTACSGYGAGNDAAPDKAIPAEDLVSQDPAAGGGDDAGEDDAAAGEDTGGDDAGGGGFASTGDIPEGGGKVFADQKVVVTQPTAGEFKAFSVSCTHQGCPVDDVSGGTINCPCHGSKFSITDGSPAGGPASKPLAAKKIKVSGDSISLA